jgi:hypothetical protein
MPIRWERRYSSYSFLISALVEGEWSASCPICTLPSLPLGEEVGWASELVWTQRLQKKSFAFARDQTPVVQFVYKIFAQFG